MRKRFVVSISRSSGSGGKEVAMALAEKLGARFFDKEILTEAARQSGLNPDLFAENDEKRTSSFLYSVVMGQKMESLPIGHRIFMAQFETIQKLAQEDSCVFLGRCADYALRESPELVTVFVNAPMEERIKRVMQVEGLDEKKAKAFVSKTDKNRSGYYNFYSGRRWGDIANYNLCIDTSVLGINGTADFIKAFCEAKAAGSCKE